MSTEIKAILFDLDGTLIDTNELIIQSFLHTLGKNYPGQYKREDVLPFIGPSLKQTFMEINPKRADEYIQEYRSFNIANHDELVREFEGVNETIAILKERGIKLAIVTTKKLDIVKKGLLLTKLDNYFDVVITFDDVKNVKPDPEPILLALEKLGANPEEALMVGDNYHDILGGKNAGTKTAGVSWTIKGKAYLEQYHPDFMLENMKDLLQIVGVEKR